MKKTTIALGLLLVIVTNLLAGCSGAKPYKEIQFLMDTVIEITAYGLNAESAVKEAFKEFKRVQDISDRFNAASQLFRINRAAGKEEVVVDAELIDIIGQSLEVSRISQGKFDVTVGALTELWGIGQKGEYVPTEQEIKQVLPLVNYTLIQIDKKKNTVYLPKPGMALDLGGVAKGYALDKAVAALERNGIKSALVNAGGDIRVIGVKPDGRPWRIGVQHPRKNDALLAKITLDRYDSAETSGDYQRYFIKDNVRYAHIIDPQTGVQPREITSVTLLSKGESPIRSSAVFLLGVERGLELLKQYPGLEAIFMTSDGKVIMTPGLGESVELEK